MLTKHLRPLAAAALLSLPFTTMAQDADSAHQNLENFGWFVAEGAQKLDLSQAEKEAFLKGVNAALDGDEGPENKQQAAMKVQQYLQKRYGELQAEKSKAFFDKLSSNPKVKKSDSGLYYEIIQEGDGQTATQEDSVKVHYEGSLVDGTVFDSSLKRGQPVTFPVSGVVPGFGEGVQLVGPGGKVKLYIPAELGYGANPPQGSQIPPNSTLIFEVEMIEVNPES